MCEGCDPPGEETSRGQTRPGTGRADRARLGFRGRRRGRNHHSVRRDIRRRWRGAGRHGGRDILPPGDVSGDGRPDLIARKASTGAVYLYKGTSAGKLSAPVTLYANWKGYKKIVGAGDLDGDGIGDLLAQDKANNLYRFNGTGRGTFTARTKLFGSWGASYNAVVGIGDLNDDGHADLVARDTAGNLYRQSGDGKGSFGARTKIGSGWGGYKSLSSTTRPWTTGLAARVIDGFDGSRLRPALTR
ncbi:VCBS repeat-containing protein [Streptomyces sp. SID12501]|uniref:FG-GAP repeat domain-containing protein n=1 Tax=Streptomyces sp. SID12501 TaxID=2706042 RepID=UPI001EF1FFF8|nr:VCBS repeat-containing protein [Streptomyces sp. SID12501]